MHRFYLPPPEISENGVSFSKEAAGKISRVLRLRPGAKVFVFDGLGVEWEVLLTQVSPAMVKGDITARTEKKEKAPRILIGQGLPKSSKMDFIVQKATELGVHSVIPLSLERCVVKVQGEKNRVQRWQRIGAESAEQCGRCTLPRISAPCGIGQFCEMTKGADLKIVLWERETETFLREFLTKGNQTPLDVAVVIGPEGGIGEEEVENLKKSGFIPVGLGGNVLRTETAALSVLSIIQFYFGCLGGKKE
ncbi:MAG: 16S rRNA (uracil(1498)-N(3))-methyltransferase [Nitrospinota bacterium]